MADINKLMDEQGDIANITGNALDINITNERIEVIQIEHDMIHEGCHFFISDFITLGNAAVGNIVIEVGTLPLHLVFTATSDIAGFLLKTFENITANADGTLITPINNNRLSTKLSTATWRLNPTGVSTTGALRMRNNKLGTAGNPSQRIGGSVNRDNEVILKANTKYLIQFTNLSTSDNDVNYNFSWYSYQV